MHACPLFINNMKEHHVPPDPQHPPPEAVWTPETVDQRLQYLIH